MHEATPQELRTLAASPLPEVRARVAEHPSTPPDVLEQLARTDPIVHVRALALLHTASPAELLVAADEAVRRAAAASVHLGPELADLLLLDPSSWVRHSLAECSTHPEVLAQLVTDVPKVTLGLVRNPHTPEAALHHLATRDELTVVPELCSHPNTPLVDLVRFARDHDPAIHRRLARRPELPSRLKEVLLVPELLAAGVEIQGDELFLVLAQDWQGTLGELREAALLL